MDMFKYYDENELVSQVQTIIDQTEAFSQKVRRAIKTSRLPGAIAKHYLKACNRNIDGKSFSIDKFSKVISPIIKSNISDLYYYDFVTDAVLMNQLYGLFLIQCQLMRNYLSNKQLRHDLAGKVKQSKEIGFVGDEGTVLLSEVVLAEKENFSDLGKRPTLDFRLPTDNIVRRPDRNINQQRQSQNRSVPKPQNRNRSGYNSGGANSSLAYNTNNAREIKQEIESVVKQQNDMLNNFHGYVESTSEGIKYISDVSNHVKEEVSRLNSTIKEISSNPVIIPSNPSNIKVAQPSQSEVKQEPKQQQSQANRQQQHRQNQPEPNTTSRQQRENEPYLSGYAREQSEKVIRNSQNRQQGQAQPRNRQLDDGDDDRKSLSRGLGKGRGRGSDKVFDYDEDNPLLMAGWQGKVRRALNRFDDSVIQTYNYQGLVGVAYKGISSLLGYGKKEPSQSNARNRTISASLSATPEQVEEQEVDEVETPEKRTSERKTNERNESQARQQTTGINADEFRQEILSVLKEAIQSQKSDESNIIDVQYQEDDVNSLLGVLKPMYSSQKKFFEVEEIYQKKSLGKLVDIHNELKPDYYRDDELPDDLQIQLRIAKALENQNKNEIDLSQLKGLGGGGSGGLFSDVLKGGLLYKFITTITPYIIPTVLTAITAYSGYKLFEGLSDAFDFSEEKRKRKEQELLEKDKNLIKGKELPSAYSGTESVPADTLQFAVLKNGDVRLLEEVEPNQEIIFKGTRKQIEEWNGKASSNVIIPPTTQVSTSPYKNSNNSNIHNVQSNAQSTTVEAPVQQSHNQVTETQQINQEKSRLDYAEIGKQRESQNTKELREQSAEYNKDKEEQSKRKLQDDNTNTFWDSMKKYGSLFIGGALAATATVLTGGLATPLIAGAIAGGTVYGVSSYQQDSYNEQAKQREDEIKTRKGESKAVDVKDTDTLIKRTEELYKSKEEHDKELFESYKRELEDRGFTVKADEENNTILVTPSEIGDLTAEENAKRNEVVSSLYEQMNSADVNSKSQGLTMWGLSGVALYEHLTALRGINRTQFDDVVGKELAEVLDTGSADIFLKKTNSYKTDQANALRKRIDSSYFGQYNEDTLKRKIRRFYDEAVKLGYPESKRGHFVKAALLHGIEYAKREVPLTDIVPPQTTQQVNQTNPIQGSSTTSLPPADTNATSIEITPELSSSDTSGTPSSAFKDREKEIAAEFRRMVTNPVAVNNVGRNASAVSAVSAGSMSSGSSSIGSVSSPRQSRQTRSQSAPTASSGSGSSVSANTATKEALRKGIKDTKSKISPISGGGKGVITNVTSLITKQPTSITSRFSGNRLHPVYKKRRPHKGIDLCPNVAREKRFGIPIKIAAAGKLKFVGQQRGYGNCVEVDHGNGWSTFYAHLNDLAGLKKGMTVQAGAPILHLGNTGVGTGAHLHFEVRKNGKQIEPIEGIKQMANALGSGAYVEDESVANSTSVSGMTPDEANLETAITDENLLKSVALKNISEQQSQSVSSASIGGSGGGSSGSGADVSEALDIGSKSGNYSQQDFHSLVAAGVLTQEEADELVRRRENPDDTIISGNSGIAGGESNATSGSLETGLDGLKGNGLNAGSALGGGSAGGSSSLGLNGMGTAAGGGNARSSVYSNPDNLIGDLVGQATNAVINPINDITKDVLGPVGGGIFNLLNPISQGASGLINTINAPIQGVTNGISDIAGSLNSEINNITSPLRNIGSQISNIPSRAGGVVSNVQSVINEKINDTMSPLLGGMGNMLGRGMRGRPTPPTSARVGQSPSIGTDYQPQSNLPLFIGDPGLIMLNTYGLFS